MSFLVKFYSKSHSEMGESVLGKEVLFEVTFAFACFRVIGSRTFLCHWLQTFASLLVMCGSNITVCLHHLTRGLGQR